LALRVNAQRKENIKMWSKRGNTQKK
jgi:hypothetical protein